ncbi:hypothetical protein K1X12_14670 [Hyphomonas sp. WL0036]|uniref:cupin domain-containing protein n=1 Tax=Hyphomonas sediminis TaxID=2866160 RepID=UPI001C7FB0E2|nr:hypothetical protein [Hyphomonas sediminis]MBY9068152.1 hypothetical protein [Hyphomonas sediminis]
MTDTRTNEEKVAELMALMPKVPPAKFVKVADIPWTSFPGYEHCAMFKILRIDPETLGHTLIFRYRTGIGAHRHLSSVEILSLGPGKWWYEGEGSAGPGDYTYEYAGAVHVAVTENDDWGESLIISKGPLQMINEDGTPGMVIDAMSYYVAAKANNAVAHLPADPFSVG